VVGIDSSEEFIKVCPCCRIKNFKPLTVEKVKYWFGVVVNPIKELDHKLFLAPLSFNNLQNSFTCILKDMAILC
jgi:hypothetical protein